MSHHRNQNDTLPDFLGRRSMLGIELPAALQEAHENGYIPIQTWTLPSGDVPIVTFMPATQFIERLAHYSRHGVWVNELTAGVRDSVATEGGRLHHDLSCALAYALINDPDDAMDWWLSVGIVRQFLLFPLGSYHGRIHALVHSNWSSQLGRGFDPSTRTVEPLFDA